MSYIYWTPSPFTLQQRELSSWWGRSWTSSLPLPSCCLPVSWGRGWTTCSQGGRKTKGLHAALSWTQHPLQ
jgi:hypothetical protein